MGYSRSHLRIGGGINPDLEIFALNKGEISLGTWTEVRCVPDKRRSSNVGVVSFAAFIITLIRS